MGARLAHLWRCMHALVLSCPPSLLQVVAVASLESSGLLSSFSNRGSWVHLGAPGGGVLSTVSMAALPVDCGPAPLLSPAAVPDTHACMHC